MRKFKVILEYDGSAYHGWQRQSNGISIQEVLETSLEKIVKAKTAVVGSGRTDAGVHAEGQTAHFRARSKMTSRQFLKALNCVLPPNITVKQVAEVPEEFDARYSAERKIYRYTLLNRDYPSALHHGRVWFIPIALDLAAMKQAGKYLLGKHDFSAFQGANSDVKNPVREIFRIDIVKERDFIRFVFEGNGFLKYMIRIIVGTLVETGKGRIRAEQVRDILNSRDRTMAGPTAPPQGL
ncbi:MAG: tRNA pseudouridine(38-40) synthase TruA, partial [Nitrospinales bacterium]